VTDAARLAAAHVAGHSDAHRVLAHDDLESMRTICAGGKPFDHGIGWFRRPTNGSGDWVEHFGAGAGWRAPQSRWTVVVDGLTDDGDATLTGTHDACETAAIAETTTTAGTNDAQGGVICLMAVPMPFGSSSGRTKNHRNNWTSSGMLRKNST